MKKDKCKIKFMDNKFKKLKRKILVCFNLGKYENCLTAISVYCELQYQYNQIYSDENIETLVEKLSKKILPSIEGYKANDKTVLFYDGFGLDLRGWAASYVRALQSLGYRIVYVTNSKSSGRIPHILRELKENAVEYIDMSSSYIKWSNDIFKIFIKYKPHTAFFYTTPYDISAAIAFNKFSGYVERFQIDLTDHAFWIGVKSVDFFLESREMGAALALYKRGVPKDRIIKTDCVPYINRDILEKDLPFDIQQERYVFTGGALYKTMGDEEHLYYHMIDIILSEFQDVYFLYAGCGDDSQMRILISKYPNRVFLIDERSDFFRIIENCTLYLNSYPMFGGLMMRYAALAGKVPLTLKHEHDAEGILLNQENLNVEYDNVDELISEARKLLLDDQYYEFREREIKNSVLTEEKFAENIYNIIKNKKSKYEFDDITLMDTAEFQKEYIERFNTEMYYSICAKRVNKRMCIILPITYIRGIIIRLRKRMIRR